MAVVFVEKEFFPVSDKIWRAIAYIGKNEIAMLILLELQEKGGCIFYDLQEFINVPVPIDNYLQGLMDCGLVMQSGWDGDKYDKYTLTDFGNALLSTLDILRDALSLALNKESFSAEDIAQAVKNDSFEVLVQQLQQLRELYGSTINED